MKPAFLLLLLLLLLPGCGRSHTGCQTSVYPNSESGILRMRSPVAP